MLRCDGSVKVLVRLGCGWQTALAGNPGHLIFLAKQNSGIADKVVVKVSGPPIRDDKQIDVTLASHFRDPLFEVCSLAILAILSANPRRS
jgi:hypothetical protein